MPKPKKRTDEEALLIAMLLLLRQDTAAHLQSQVRAYTDGTTSLYSLASQLTATLLGAHAQAVYLGRRLAGASAPMGDADRQFAATVMAEQQAFLMGLLSDIHAGKYKPNADGSLPGALVQRLKMYAAGLQSTANKAWIATLPATVKIWWTLGAPENHCEECPALAAGSPYTPETLPTVPLACATPCLTNCSCSLVTEDGAEGF